MANCVQANPCRPRLFLPNLSPSRHHPRTSSVLSVRVNRSLIASLRLAASASRYLPVLKQRQCLAVARYHQGRSVCLLGGKGKSEENNEASPWKSTEKDTNTSKRQSVEDVLREQIEKQEFYDEGRGKKPPRGGGGGGGGGDNSGGSEDGNFAGALQEAMQVVFATLGLLFVYFYTISGEEMILLARDYISYIFKGIESNRLKKVLDEWRKVGRLFHIERREEDKLWSEKAILGTQTSFDSAERYRRIFGSDLSSDSQ